MPDRACLHLVLRSCGETSAAGIGESIAALYPERQNRINTGIFGAWFVPEVLSRAGYTDLALELVAGKSLPWLGMVGRAGSNHTLG